MDVGGPSQRSLFTIAKLLLFGGKAQRRGDAQVEQPAADDDGSAADPDGEPGQHAGAAVDGGICTAAPDFFTIDLAGDWRVDLAFSAAQADLDVYVMNVATGEPLVVGDAAVGSYGTTDLETFTHNGPATIVVVGYEGGSTTYALTLTDLGTPAPTPAP